MNVTLAVRCFETSLIISLLNAPISQRPLSSLTPNSMYICFQLRQHLSLKPFVSWAVIITGPSQKDKPTWCREPAKAALQAGAEAGVQHPAPSSAPAHHGTKSLIKCTDLDLIK